MKYLYIVVENNKMTATKKEFTENDIKKIKNDKKENILELGNIIFHNKDYKQIRPFLFKILQHKKILQDYNLISLITMIIILVLSFLLNNIFINNKIGKIDKKIDTIASTYLSGTKMIKFKKPICKKLETNDIKKIEIKKENLLNK